MKKNFISILITSYNKGNFLEKTIKSCLSQNFKNKEIIVFEDGSTDNSKKILGRFKKKIIIINNKKKRFDSSPQNQINGIIELFKRSKGEIIFLLDADDQFKKGKLSYIFKIFQNKSNLNFIQDKPYLSDKKKYMLLKKKKHYFSIWPSFYPTSCMTVRRKFFQNFLKHLYKNEFSNLEIDARLSMFAHLKNEFCSIEKNLTIYNYDEFGITSNYKKFNISWWKKRNEAFNYLIKLKKRLNKSFSFGPDFYLTRIINFFI